MAALASNSSFVAPAAPQATPNDQVYLKISAPPGPCTCGESTCSLKMGHSLGQPSSRRQDTQRVSRIRAIYEARPAPALRIAPRHVSSSSSGSSKGKSSANTSEREWDKVWGDFCCTPAATPSSASVRSRQSGETLQTKSDPPSAQVKQIASFGLGTLHLRPTSGERRASMPLSANSSQGEHPHDAPLLRRASSFSPADYPTYRSKGSEPMLRDGSSSSGTPALSPSLSLSLSLPSPLTPAMSRGWTDDLDIHPAHLPPVRSSGYAMPPYPSNAEERSEGGPAPFVPGLLRAGAKPKLPDPFARYRPSSPATATAPLSRDLPMRSPYGMLLPPPISPRYSPRYSPRSPLWHGTDLPLPSISAVLAHDPSADEPLDPALERKSPDSALTPVSLTQSPIINLIEPLPIENCGAQNLACRRRQRALSLAEMRPIPLKHNDEDDAAMNVDGATAMRPSHSATDAPSSGTRPQIVVEACNPADLMLIDRIAPRKSDSTSQLRSTAPKTGDASLPLELPRLNTERTEVAVERPLLRLPLPPLTISVPSSRASSSGTTSATSPSSFAPSPVSPTPPVVPQTSIPPPPKAPSPTNIAPSSSPSPTIPSPSSSSPSVLFPRHGQVPKRTNTRPPAHEFNRPPEQAHLEPRAQAPKFDGDLYTPLWVRLGKGGSGASAAKAQAGSKEGWCGLCERDGDGRGGWLHLRNSSYRCVLCHYSSAPF